MHYSDSHSSDEDEASSLPVLQSQPLGKTEEYEIENMISPVPSEDLLESAACSTPEFSDLENDVCESENSIYLFIVNFTEDGLHKRLYIHSLYKVLPK